MLDVVFCKKKSRMVNHIFQYLQVNASKYRYLPVLFANLNNSSGACLTSTDNGKKTDALYSEQWFGFFLAHGGGSVRFVLLHVVAPIMYLGFVFGPGFMIGYFEAFLFLQCSCFYVCVLIISILPTCFINCRI